MHSARLLLGLRLAAGRMLREERVGGRRRRRRIRGAALSDDDFHSLFHVRRRRPRSSIRRSGRPEPCTGRTKSPSLTQRRLRFRCVLCRRGASAALACRRLCFAAAGCWPLGDARPLAARPRRRARTACARRERSATAAASTAAPRWAPSTRSGCCSTSNLQVRRHVGKQLPVGCPASADCRWRPRPCR